MLFSKLSTTLHCAKRFMSLSKAASLTKSRHALVPFLKNWKDSNGFGIVQKYENQLLEPSVNHKEACTIFCNYMMIALNQWYEVPDEKFAELRDVMEQLQDSILFLDDIIDGSETRQGIPTPNVIYGVPFSSNCAVFNISRIQELAFKHAKYDKEFMKLWTEFMISVYRAEGYDKIWSTINYCPTIEEHNLVLIYKNGLTICLLGKMLEIWSDRKVDLTKFSTLFMSYLQYFDDNANYFKAEADFKTKECFASDLTEGKYTLPIVHAIKTKKNKEIAEIIQRKPKDLESRRRAVKIMKELGTQEYGQEVFEQMDQAIRDELAVLGPNPIMDIMLDKIMSLTKVFKNI